MRAGVRVLDAGDEDLRVREPRGDHADEVDRSADADVDRRGAPRLGHRRPRRRVRGTVRSGRRTAGRTVARRHRHRRTPRRVRLQVGDQGVARGVGRRRRARCAASPWPARWGTASSGRRRPAGASMPMTEIAGRGPQPGGQRAGADQLYAVEHPGVGAQLARRSGRAGRRAPRRSPATATSPRSSCSVASSRTSAVSASGTGPPYTPLWTACRSVRTSTTDVEAAAQRGGQRRYADPPVGRVGEHDDVGGEPVAERGEEPVQGRRADLLLALDEDGHPDREVVAERAQRGEVHARCRPCRRRRRGRTAARRAPSARTGRSSQSPRSPGGCTSWCAYSSTVGAPGGPRGGRAPPDGRRRRCDHLDVVQCPRPSAARRRRPRCGAWPRTPSGRPIRTGSGPAPPDPPGYPALSGQSPRAGHGSGSHADVTASRPSLGHR